MLRAPASSAVPWLWRLVIKLIRQIRGEAAAAHKEAELMKPDRIRRSGYYALMVGGGLLIGGCLQLAGWIIKVLGIV